VTANIVDISVEIFVAPDLLPVMSVDCRSVLMSDCSLLPQQVASHRWWRAGFLCWFVVHIALD